VRGEKGSQLGGGQSSQCRGRQLSFPYSVSFRLLALFLPLESAGELSWKVNGQPPSWKSFQLIPPPPYVDAPLRTPWLPL